MQITLFREAEASIWDLNWLQSPMHWLQSCVLAMNMLFRHWWRWSVTTFERNKSFLSVCLCIFQSFYSSIVSPVLWFLGVAVLRSEQMRSQELDANKDAYRPISSSMIKLMDTDLLTLSLFENAEKCDLVGLTAWKTAWRLESASPRCEAKQNLVVSWS